MKILQILDKGPQDGGVAVHVSALSAQLEKRGHQISCLRLVDKKSAAPGSASDGHRLPYSYGLIPGHLLRQKLRQLLLETKPRLIHIHGCFTTLSPILLSDLRRYGPLVGTLHDIRPFCYLMTRRFAPTGALCQRHCGAGCFASGCVRPTGLPDILRLPRRWLMDGLMLGEWRKIERVIVPSSYVRELALQHGLPARHLRLVPHGTTVPARRTSKEHGAFPPLVLFLGNLRDYKGVGLLAEAFGFLGERPWQAIVAGEGPMYATLKQDLERRGLSGRVRLCGHVANRDDVNDLLARARLLVIPSVIPESFSLAGIEALAMGTPVVSFGLGGLREWLRDGENGLIAADGDARDLARQMSRLLDDPILAGSMGKRGHELVATNFSADQAVDRLLTVYHELL